MNTFTKLSICGLALLLGNTLQAQNKISGFKLLNAVVRQYEKAEWDISVNASFGNPYLQEEIALDLLLTSPSGRKLLLPCYYEAGQSGTSSVWKARFMPQEKGKYTFNFQLTTKGDQAILSRSSTFTAVKSDKRGILHSNDDWTFKFDDGTPFRGVGENLCWESRADDDSKFFKALHEKEKYNYEYMLPSLIKHGGNYFRTWICSWNLPLDWKSGFNNHRYTASDEYFNPSAIKKMDRLVNLSDSLGIYMMLTLGEGTHDQRNGRFATSTPDFFINAQAKAQYKNRLRFIVARWGYSPAIGAWEFFNEIDNVQFRNASNPIPAANIVQWHDEMSTYLKQIDPYQHLVTTSISHRDLEGLNSLKNIDFNQKHIYKNNRALPTTIVKYARDFKKPYVIGEYGYEYDWSKNFNLFAEEMDSDFKRGLWYGLFTPTPIVPLSWWWEFFDDRGTDAYIARVRTISDQMLAAGKGSFESLNAKASLPEIEIYSVKCGVKTFVYVYNPTKEPKKPVLELDQTKNTRNAIKMYNCESGTYSDAKGSSAGGKLQISGFELPANTDAVFIF
jgi:hypothetical protein